MTDTTQETTPPPPAAAPPTAAEPAQEAFYANVKPMPQPYWVDAKLSKSMYEQRVALHRRMGDEDPDLQVAIWTLLQAAEQELQRPVVWIDRNSCGHVRHHDSVTVAGIVFPLPTPVLESGVADFDRFFRETATLEKALQVAAANRLAEMQVEARSELDLDRRVEAGDMVMLKAWNTGLGRGATADLIVTLDDHHPELREALLGRIAGHSAIGRYPIRYQGQEVFAQKVELVGCATAADITTDGMAAKRGLTVQALREAVILEVGGDQVRLTAALNQLFVAHALSHLELSPIPTDLVAQVSQAELAAEIERDGAVATLQRYGAADQEEAVYARMEQDGSRVHAAIAAYWILRQFARLPDEKAVQAYCKEQDIGWRAYGLLRLCLELAVVRYADLAAPSAATEEVKS